MMQKYTSRIRDSVRKVSIVLQALVLATAGFTPLLLQGNAYAQQLTSRYLRISTGSNAGSNATTSYEFGFVVPSTSAVQGVKLLACTTALGTCTAPTGLSFDSATVTAQTNWADNTTNFTVDNTGANDCIPTANSHVFCATRTTATAESGSAVRTLTLGSVQNPTTLGTFFVRITTYSTTNYTGGGIVDSGTVASSTTQALTVNAAVQEVLAFCVGATAVNDATTSTGANCTAITGTSVNLGTLDSARITVSPVDTATGGDDNNGVAMLRTNAVNGASVQYKAVQQTGSNHQGTLRVSGATCNAGTVNTDQCINAQGSAKGTFTAGAENFGMSIAAVNCGSVGAYTCDYSLGTYNLTRAANYNNTGADTVTSDIDQVAGTTNGQYAWVESGTATQIASSNTVVDNEALILKFAATPNITTPTGSYTALADYIATPTY